MYYCDNMFIVYSGNSHTVTFKVVNAQ